MHVLVLCQCAWERPRKSRGCSLVTKGDIVHDMIPLCPQSVPWIPDGADEADEADEASDILVWAKAWGLPTWQVELFPFNTRPGVDLKLTISHNPQQPTGHFFWCIFMHVQLCYFWTWRLWFSTPLSNGADCEKFQSAACTNTDGCLMPIWRPSTFTEVAWQFYNMGHAMGSTSNLAFVLPESLPRLVTTRQSTRTGHFRSQSWAILDDF